MTEHVPVITGNYLPFRLVVRDEEDIWSPTIDEINRRTYDYVKLNRASTFIDIGIAPFSLVICFDGTFALPAIKEFRDPDKALLEFNKVLCQLFVGGVYCEAMSPEDICFGMMTHTAYCKITAASRGSVSNFHKAIRSKHAGELDVIRLFKPETNKISSIQSAIELGRNRLNDIGSVSPETFLYGATFFSRNQWSESLIHLWTTIEQIAEIIWKEQITTVSNVDGISRKKRTEFLNDTRTWTISTKFELMYQKKLLPEETSDLPPN